MSDVSDNNFIRYIYRGQEGERIPDDATHIFVDKSVTVIRAWAFYGHPAIIEVICHDDVETIEQEAFFHCTSLRRVIMPGVTIVDRGAFESCHALMDVECDKLVKFHVKAFYRCTSLRSINLPSIKVAQGHTFFQFSAALKDVKFGNKLERFEGTFLNCRSLERITIPLKDGIITGDDIFRGCESLKRLNLVEGELHETIDALQLDDWKNDMNEEIESINHILTNTPAGGGHDDNNKARAIREWMRSVLLKINHYKAEHQRMLDGEVATTLQEHALPQEIMMKNVLPFLELPSHTFEVGDDGRGER